MSDSCENALPPRATVTECSNVLRISGPPSTPDAREEAPSRSCRYCLRCEGDGLEELIAPCGCTGSAKWVHQCCLRSWMQAVMQRGGDPSRCELCRQPYDLGRKMWLQKIWWFVRSLGGPEGQRYSLVLVLALVASSWISSLNSEPPFPYTALVCWGLICSFGTLLTASTGRAIHIACAALALFLPMISLMMAKRAAVQELRPGVVLRFSPHLQAVGGVFSRSIVLVTKYGYSLGAEGYIINSFKGGAPSERGPFARAGSRLEDVKGLRHGVGGPVPIGLGDGWEVIHWGGRPDAVREASAAGVPGVYVGGRREDILTALTALSGSADEPSPSAAFHALAVYGYSGWSPRQLDGEVRSGVWTIHNVTAELLFQTSPELLYERIGELPTEGKWGTAAESNSR